MSIPSSASFRMELLKEPAPILHDRVKIEQAVLNICINAAHALEGKPGEVKLGLDRVEVTGAHAARLRARDIESNPKHFVSEEHADGTAELWRGVLQQGAHLRISVADTGIGMDAATLAKIFDPFFTTKPTGVGTGLGLPSVAGILEAHGGAIHVRTRKSMGTVFALFLPMAGGLGAADGAPDAMARVMNAPAGEDAPAPATAAATPFQVAEPVAAQSGAETRILLVDDEMQVLELMEMALIRAGFEPEAYGNPVKALERLREEPDGFDLVLTDQTMPNMTGTMLADAIQDLRPDLPVLMATAYPAGLSNLPAVVAGVLAKPFEPEDLVRSIRTILARQKAVGRPPAPVRRPA
jgi:CheY-like chemotaxis protein